MSQAILLALLAVMAALMVYAAWGDLRTRLIPNWLNVLIAVTGLAWWLVAGLTPLGFAVQIGLALAVFGLFTIAFALGMMGGGDVKMLGALAVWLPFEALTRMLMIMAIVGGVVTVIFLARHRIAKMQGQPEIPYGVAIAIAGLWEVGQRYLYQFS